MSIEIVYEDAAGSLWNDPKPGRVRKEISLPFASPTPGPWWVGEKNPDPDGLPEIIINATNTLRGGVRDRYAVAAALPCCGGVISRDLMPEMTLANARLIAAAPSAIACCRALRDAEKSEDAVERGRLLSLASHMASVAILKAGGPDSRSSDAP